MGKQQRIICRKDVGVGNRKKTRNKLHKNVKKEKITKKIKKKSNMQLPMSRERVKKKKVCQFNSMQIVNIKNSK